jgi:hypothetical protein
LEFLRFAKLEAGQKDPYFKEGGSGVYYYL